MEQKTSVFQKIWFWLIIAFFYLPIIYVVFFSFNKSKSLTKFTGFSLRWYERMFESRPNLEAIGYTPEEATQEQDTENAGNSAFPEMDQDRSADEVYPFWFLHRQSQC